MGFITNKDILPTVASILPIIASTLAIIKIIIEFCLNTQNKKRSHARRKNHHK